MTSVNSNATLCIGYGKRHDKIIFPEREHAVYFASSRECDPDMCFPKLINFLNYLETTFTKYNKILILNHNGAEILIGTSTIIKMKKLVDGGEIWFMENPKDRKEKFTLMEKLHGEYLYVNDEPVTIWQREGMVNYNGYTFLAEHENTRPLERVNPDFNCENDLDWLEDEPNEGYEVGEGERTDGYELEGDSSDTTEDELASCMNEMDFS
jgi:hypothetical protein